MLVSSDRTQIGLLVWQKVSPVEAWWPRQIHIVGRMPLRGWRSRGNAIWLKIQMAVPLGSLGFASVLKRLCGRLAVRIRPAARNCEAAIRAAAVLQPVLLYVVPRAPDQKRLAGRARRVRAIAVNVPLVDIMQSRFQRDHPRGVQSFRRRARLVLQLEIRMKRREVQRYIRPQVFEHPL